MARKGSRQPTRPRPIVWSLILILAATSFPHHPAPAKQPSEQQTLSVRNVRVRLTIDATRVRIQGETAIEITDAAGHAKPSLDAHSPHIFSRAGNRLHAAGPGYTSDGFTLGVAGNGSITVVIDQGSGWSPSRSYAGRIRLQRRDNGKIAIFNDIDVEHYVASVVAHEVWPTFAQEAYRAQAIAARSYVLFTMLRRRDAKYDIQAGQGAQVYRGVRDDDIGRRATDAAKYTRGIVCTWNDENVARLFSAFYSAVCGGMTQSAGLFGHQYDIKPLSGSVRCDYCKDAQGDTYRWGPIKIDKRTVRSRLVARHPKSGLSGSITKIEVTERSPQNRPVKLRVTGSRGRPLEISAESFRLAVGSDRMRSAECTIRVTERHIVLENGRGFGHGVGICQWGANGLAQRGRTAAEILRFYYPGSNLVRAY